MNSTPFLTWRYCEQHTVFDLEPLAPSVLPFGSAAWIKAASEDRGFGEKERTKLQHSKPSFPS